MKKSDFKSASNPELLSIYSQLMEEFRNRGIVRTGNNPVADYAEIVAVENLNLIRSGKEERGFDATDSKGRKYQIKGRRITRHNSSRQLGVIRDLDERLFDYLIAVIFEEDFSVKEIWQIPYEFVKKHSRHSVHQNGHIFQAKQQLLASGTGVQRIL